MLIVNINNEVKEVVKKLKPSLIRNAFIKNIIKENNNVIDNIVVVMSSIVNKESLLLIILVYHTLYCLNLAYKKHIIFK